MTMRIAAWSADEMSWACATTAKPMSNPRRIPKRNAMILILRRRSCCDQERLATLFWRLASRGGFH
jgi:hypothetical protein